MFRVPHTTGNQASGSHKETKGDIEFLSRKIRSPTSENMLLSVFLEAIDVPKESYFKDYSSNRINKTSIPLSKYLTSSVTTVKGEPMLISLNKPKSMTLNRVSSDGGIAVTGATCWPHANAASLGVGGI